MTFSLLDFINDFLNFENHLHVLAYIIPFNVWNTNIPITFHYIYIYILGTLKSCMRKIRFIILYWFLPYISVVFINQKERKIDKKFVAIIDAVCFLALFLFAYDYSDVYFCLPLSYYEMYDWYNAYLITLGVFRIISSFLYSICFNFRLLKKYLGCLGIQKYEKLLFWISVILLIIVSYIFLFLHLTYLN